MLTEGVDIWLVAQLQVRSWRSKEQVALSMAEAE